MGLRMDKNYAGNDDVYGINMNKLTTKEALSIVCGNLTFYKDNELLVLWQQVYGDVPPPMLISSEDGKSVAILDESEMRYRIHNEVLDYLANKIDKK